MFERQWWPRKILNTGIECRIFPGNDKKLKDLKSTFDFRDIEANQFLSIINPRQLINVLGGNSSNQKFNDYKSMW